MNIEKTEHGYRIHHAAGGYTELWCNHSGAESAACAAIDYLIGHAKHEMDEIAELHRAIDATEKAKAEFLSVLQKYWSGTINELIEAVQKQNELIGDFLDADSHDAMNFIYLRAEIMHGEISQKVGADKTANA